MPERKTIPLPIGGMATAGDPAARQNTLPKVKNCFLRPGPRLEKRGGWLKDTLATTPYGMLLERIDTSGNSILMHDSAATNGTGKRASDGTWSGISGATNYASDFVNVAGVSSGSAFSKIYVAQAKRVGAGWGAYSYDGTTLDLTPFTSAMFGQTIAYFNGRIFLGQTGHYLDNVGTIQQDITNAAKWTLAGGPPTVALSAGNVYEVTIVNGSTDSLKTAAAIYTTTAEETVTLVQPIRNANDDDIPLTLFLENAAGTVIYASKEVIAPGIGTTVSGWSLHTLNVTVAASTALYLRILVGNVSSGAATVGLVFGTSDTGVTGFYTGYAPQLLAGRHVSFAAGRYGTLLSSDNYFADPSWRIRWSQADDPTDWRAVNYYDCTATPGAITVLRAADSKLYAFKDDSIYIFKSGVPDELPITEELVIKDVGCVGPKAIDSFSGRWYFADANSVYEWDGDGEIVDICGEGMRAEVFETQPTVVTVDHDKREVYVVSGTRIFVFSLDLRAWTYLTVTGASDSALAVSDLWYGQPTGESAREMWCLLTDGAAAKQIAKLRTSQTTENVDGTARNVVAEIEFAPLESPYPGQEVTVQAAKIKHKISASQSASTTTLSWSEDGGSTYPATCTKRISPLSTGADSDWKTSAPFPLQRTAERSTLKITHDGLAGPTYFQISGAEADVLVRGRSVAKSSLTAVSDTL